MHILIIPSEHFVTEKQPLGAIFQMEQARVLSAAGHTVGVLSVGFISLRYFCKSYPYKKKEDDQNLHIYRSYKRSFLIERYISLARGTRRYFHLFEKLFNEYTAEHGRPDIIHAHNFFFAGSIASKIFEKYRIPFVITEHSSAFIFDKIPARNFAPLREIGISAAGLFCVSSPFQRILQERLQLSFSVLPNIVDNIFFEASLAERTKTSFQFINVARLDRNKNQALLLSAFADQFKGTPVGLTIIGDGPLKNRLRRYARDLGIEKQVTFTGQLNRTAVRDAMAKSHCFVLSSQVETFGVVLIEALACGLPLIATRCGGPEDIIHDQNGLLIKSNNIAELGQAMLSMEKNSKKFNRGALRREAQSRFGAAAFVERTEKIYQEALNPES